MLPSAQIPTISLSPQFICTTLRGRQLIKNPLLNKGSAFTAEEREVLGLWGLLPPNQETLETQLQRTYQAYCQKSSAIEKHIYLRALQDTNEVLFYALLQRHISEMLPIIYAPTVGEACQLFHKIYRRSRGLFIAYPERDKIEVMFDNLDMDQVDVIVVSDGERILGLGDQGLGGMAIPIGKVSLYTACGGVHPGRCLPIILDTGTDNEELLNDPLYFGWRHKRIRGSAYDDFIESFVHAIKKKFPQVLLQWEDFAIQHAHFLLEKYESHLCTFNDDIQGTAAVALAGLLAAIRVTKSTLPDQRIVILGAGTAGIGIADQLVNAMKEDGISQSEALSKFWLVDKEGLLTTNQVLRSFQIPYAKDLNSITDWIEKDQAHSNLQGVITYIKPTILIGVSTAFQAFTEPLIREMAKHVQQPIIFPLSNPPSHCEAEPKDLIEWTDGRALIATGTKYPDIYWNGKLYRIGQCNNYFIFPAMGLATIASKTSRISNQMFLAAAKALSFFAPALSDVTDSLFPSPENIHKVSCVLAVAIGMQAQKDGFTATFSEIELKEKIDALFWKPVYPQIITQSNSVNSLDQM